MLARILLFGGSALMSSGAARPDTVAEHAIKNVNLIDVAAAEVVTGQTVVTGDGRILAVGSNGEIDIPANAVAVDGGGRYLSPGLINMHAHLGDWEFDGYPYVAYGVTTIRSMDGTPRHVALREAVAAGAAIGPNITTSGPILYGNGPQWEEEPSVRAAAERIVREHLETRYDFLKVYYQVGREQYLALSDAATRGGLPVVGHVPWSLGVTGMFAGGQATNEHLSGYDVYLQPPDSEVRDVHTAWGEILRYQRIDSTRVDELAAAAASSGIWDVPTLVIYENWLEPEKVRRRLANEALMALLSPASRKSWLQYNQWQIPPLEQQSPQDRAMMRTAAEVRRRIVAALHRSGANLAVGTDGPGARFVFPGLSVHEELAILVRAGLSPAASLRAATIDGAAAMGRAGQFGEIRVGQRADLVLLEKNPIRDIHATRSIAGVMVAGRWYSRASLDDLLASLRSQH